jgi:3-oxoacyl-[acyl-carrier-protein] synthase II
VDPLGMRPFAQDRRGVTLGEGAAAFLVEKPGRRPTLARLLGAAMVAEAHHPTHPQASGEGAERAVRLALQDAALQAGDIDAVSAHGTATLLNDASEVQAMRRIFGERIALASHKSQLGHTLGAAGALETAVCLLMLRKQRLYPTFALRHVAEDCAGVDHVQIARNANLRAIVKNSFAFGGQNSALVLAC